MSSKFETLFGNRKPVIGMIHLKALPGSPGHAEKLDKIFDSALRDADSLVEGGVSAIQVENQFDTPYFLPDDIGPETVAFITVIADRIKKNYPDTPLGINVHLNGAKQAIAIAKATGAEFIRCFNLMNAYISASGYIGASAPELMRYKKSIAAEDIMVFGDFQVKHGSHSITIDRTLEEKAHDIQIAKADAAILTGVSTGVAPDAENVTRVKKSISIPLLVGSGITKRNSTELWPLIDGAIIGSGFKPNGDLTAPIDKDLVKEFVKTVKLL
ncbi:MAG: BtpA/SgcQ family protein [Ruminococcaceae bacterium]|nr:BtpA/SgcQ family protein [Oscillospiraceae bacterium]